MVAKLLATGTKGNLTRRLIIPSRATGNSIVGEGNPPHTFHVRKGVIAFRTCEEGKRSNASGIRNGAADRSSDVSGIRGCA